MSADIPTVKAHPLLQRLVRDFQATWIDDANAEAFAAGAGERVLFFSGDPVRFPECLDVAVVLPELQASFPGRMHVGVVVPAEEDAVARRFGANRWPSLVFMREGRYVDTIAGMQDWTDYVQRVRDTLERPATRRPGVGIPVVSAEGQASSCH